MTENPKINTQPSCEDPVDIQALHFQQAQQRILNAITPLERAESVATEELVGRILAAEVISPLNVPPRDNSAVDGYALHHSDLPAAGTTAEIEIQGTALAGHPCSESLKPGHAIHITTGASIPDGCDTVIMQEQVEKSDNAIRIDSRHKAGQNIRKCGEDISIGGAVLPAGKMLTPADVGVISSLGYTHADVQPRLKVSVFSTGDEITALGQPLKPGCIYDSNRHCLLAALKKLSAVEVVQSQLLPDNPESLQAAFSKAALESDLIITTGGVSVGSADFTRQVLTRIGHIELWKIALKPGRPLAFGSINDATFIGLPGNPVASLITFYLLVLPLIWKKLGAIPPRLPFINATAAQRFNKKPGRTEMQRGVLVEGDHFGSWSVKSTGQQGSGILTSMSQADVIIVLPHDKGPIEKGETVSVLPISCLL